MEKSYVPFNPSGRWMGGEGALLDRAAVRIGLSQQAKAHRFAVEANRGNSARNFTIERRVTNFKASAKRRRAIDESISTELVRRKFQLQLHLRAKHPRHRSARSLCCRSRV